MKSENLFPNVSYTIFIISISIIIIIIIIIIIYLQHKAVFTKTPNITVNATHCHWRKYGKFKLVLYFTSSTTNITFNMIFQTIPAHSSSVRKTSLAEVGFGLI